METLTVTSIRCQAHNWEGGSHCSQGHGNSCRGTTRPTGNDGGGASDRWQTLMACFPRSLCSAVANTLSLLILPTIYKWGNWCPHLLYEPLEVQKGSLGFFPPHGSNEIRTTASQTTTISSSYTFKCLTLMRVQWNLFFCQKPHFGFICLRAKWSGWCRLLYIELAGSRGGSVNPWEWGELIPAYSMLIPLLHSSFEHFPGDFVWWVGGTWQVFWNTLDP